MDEAGRGPARAGRIHHHVKEPAPAEFIVSGARRQLKRVPGDRLSRHVPAVIGRAPSWRARRGSGLNSSSLTPSRVARGCSPTPRPTSRYRTGRVQVDIYVADPRGGGGPGNGWAKTGEPHRAGGSFTVGRARRATRRPPDRPAEWSRVVSAEMMRKLGAAVEFPLAPRGGASTKTLRPMPEELRAVPRLRAAGLPLLQQGLRVGSSGVEPSGGASALS
jgi:hypothetical protein